MKKLKEHLMAFLLILVLSFCWFGFAYGLDILFGSQLTNCYKQGKMGKVEYALALVSRHSRLFYECG